MPTSTKTVKGKKYLYFTYYDQQLGTKKEIYCGLDSDHNAKRKAIELELDHLDSQTAQLTKRKVALERQLEKFSI